MAKYKQVRIPSPGELWRRSTTYYVVQRNGKFKKLQFEIHECSPVNFRQLIRSCCLVGDASVQFHVSDSDGREGWTLVADDWILYVKEAFQRKIEDFRTILAQCEEAIGVIR